VCEVPNEALWGLNMFKKKFSFERNTKSSLVFWSVGDVIVYILICFVLLYEGFFRMIIKLGMCFVWFDVLLDKNVKEKIIKLRHHY
jgi:hypothetical protein